MKEIVIKIPEDAYDYLINTSFKKAPKIMFNQSAKDGKHTTKLFDAIDAIKNGTPLPEHHGKEPFINKPCISEGVCREDKMQVLDKIRAEIVELTKCPYGTECLGANCPSNTDCMICGDHVLEILDKYRTESEE